MKLKPEPFATPQAATTSLQDILAYHFRDASLLRQALGSWDFPLSPEAAAVRQRLEFLGDAVWDFAVAVAAFHLWPQATAGELTRFRASSCSTRGLADLARRIGLPVPHGSAAPEPSDRVLAEMFEAILGAMVEDGGLDAIRALAHRAMAKEVTATAPPLDSKSALQMLAQARYGTLPVYRLLERRGPAHHPSFRVSAQVSSGETGVLTEAQGPSRQAAEQEAARLALLRLGGGEDS